MILKKKINLFAFLSPLQNPEQTFLQKRMGKKKKNVPDRMAGPFLALLGQLEVKVAWADILISTLDLVNPEKLNHSTRLSMQRLWLGLSVFGFLPLKYLMGII